MLLASRAGTVLLLIGFTFMLSGCTGDDGTKVAGIGAPEAQFDESTGGILGVLLDENELPIVGAQVALVASGEERTTETDTSGVFAFGLVPPGDHKLLAVALGYVQGGKTVSVTAGQVTDVQLVLVQAASTEPYGITLTERRTISAFDVKPLPQCYYVSDYAPAGGSLKTCFGTTLGDGCDDPTPCFWNWTDVLTENPNWKTIINEGMWTGSSAVTGRSFSIDLATPSYRSGSYNYNDKEVFVDEGNDPPLLIRIDHPDTFLERDLPEEEYCCGWHTRLFGASCTNGYCYAGFGPDYGILIDQTIDLYFSFGFNAPLAPDFTAVPEES